MSVSVWSQLLYASFLSSGAQISVCLSEERRRAVLLRLSPAFEDLFDPAEEHALNVLLEPWTLLSQTLRDALHTVRYFCFFISVLCFALLVSALSSAMCFTISEL